MCMRAFRFSSLETWLRLSNRVHTPHTFSIVDSRRINGKFCFCMRYNRCCTYYHHVHSIEWKMLLWLRSSLDWFYEIRLQKNRRRVVLPRFNDDDGGGSSQVRFSGQGYSEIKSESKSARQKRVKVFRYIGNSKHHHDHQTSCNLSRRLAAYKWLLIQNSLVLTLEKKVGCVWGRYCSRSWLVVYRIYLCRVVHIMQIVS